MSALIDSQNTCMPPSSGGGGGSQGPQGPQGSQGNQGTQGPGVGTQGPQGAQGSAGFQGPQGSAGATGSPGSTGSQGPQGNQGAAGSTGTQGPQGTQGFQGSVGATGNQGPQGSTGNTGVQGPQGTQGNTGSTGTQGPQGVQGAAGATGAQGPQGSQGNQGTFGINAFTTTTADFTQPAVNSNVTVSVVNSTWMAVDQVIFITTGGYYQVVSFPDSTHVILKNLGYSISQTPGATISSGSKVSPGGVTGPQGFQGDQGSQGTGVPASPDMSVQFNNSGSFGGSSAFRFEASGAQALFGSPNSVAGRAVFYNTPNINTLTVQASATTPSYTLSLPPDPGTNHFILQTDGSGNTSFVDGSNIPNINFPAQVYGGSAALGNGNGTAVITTPAVNSMVACYSSTGFSIGIAGTLSVVNNGNGTWTITSSAGALDTNTIFWIAM